MLTCPKCGVDPPDKAYLFCVNCGGELAEEIKTVVRPRASRPRPLDLFVIAFGVLLALIIATAFVLTSTRPTREVAVANDRRATANVAAMQTPTPVTTVPIATPNVIAETLATPKRPDETVVNETRTIRAGDIWAVPVRMDEAATLHGGFTVGGGGKDIDAYVIDADNYALYSSGQAFRSYKAFNRVARGIIDLPLGAGTYFLVFSNRHALWYSKQIATEITIQH